MAEETKYERSKSEFDSVVRNEYVDLMNSAGGSLYSWKGPSEVRDSYSDPTTAADSDSQRTYSLDNKPKLSLVGRAVDKVKRTAAILALSGAALLGDGCANNYRWGGEVSLGGMYSFPGAAEQDIEPNWAGGVALKYEREDGKGLAGRVSFDYARVSNDQVQNGIEAKLRGEVFIGGADLMWTVDGIVFKDKKEDKGGTVINPYFTFGARAVHENNKITIVKFNVNDRRLNNFFGLRAGAGIKINKSWFVEAGFNLPLNSDNADFLVDLRIGYGF